MSAIVNAIIAQKHGRQSIQHESGASEGKTIGHDGAHGGLRGHSIDASTYPWRVGIIGSSWTVEGPDGYTAASFTEKHGRGVDEACRLAHNLARYLKRQFPSGRIEDYSNKR